MSRVDVIGGSARHHRMHAAGIVAHHAAEGVVIVGRWIGTEGEAMLFRSVAQNVENAPRFNARELFCGIDFDDAVQVFREVHQNRCIARLAAKTGPAAARQERRAVFAAAMHRRKHIRYGLRDDHSDGDLPVVGCVGRIQRPAHIVEAHLTLDVPLQLGGEALRRLF